MNRSGLFAAIAIAVAAASLAGCAGEAESAPPNIIFVLTDDQRYDQLGFVNPALQTPNLDRLAAGGVHFQNAFVTTSSWTKPVLRSQWSRSRAIGF